MLLRSVKAAGKRTREVIRPHVARDVGQNLVQMHPAEAGVPASGPGPPGSTARIGPVPPDEASVPAQEGARGQAGEHQVNGSDNIIGTDKALQSRFVT
jgi:hypothetical protein